MNLTKEQIRFLDNVCEGRGWWINSNGEVDVKGNVDMSEMNLTEIPVKFGKVEGYFNCSNNQLTSLKNLPNYILTSFDCSHNKLTSLKTSHLRFGIGYNMGLNDTGFYFKGNLLNDYFKNIKRRDFKFWERLNWNSVLSEYPFLVNIGKKYINRNYLKHIIDFQPQIKFYLKD